MKTGSVAAPFFTFVDSTRIASILRAAAWCALVLLCTALGDLARWAGLPAAHLLVALLTGITVALAGLVRRPFPRGANRAAQATVGALMGGYLDPAAVREVAGTIVPLAFITLATIVLCVASARLLPRMTAMSRPDAVLGMVPGGSAAIISCAEELDADSRVVAFMQYLRVGLVAASTPVVVLAVGALTHSGVLAASADGPLLPERLLLVAGPQQITGVVVLAAMCALGIQVGRRLRLPAPALMGTMLITAIGVFSGAAVGFQPTGVLQDVVFTMIGLEVGLRFTPDTVRHVGRVLPHVVAVTAAVCLACAALAAALAVAIHIPFLDAYLATTPGGINAVLATAADAHSHLALISTTQSLRLFLVVFLAPPLIRWAVPARQGTGRRTPQKRQPGNVARSSIVVRTHHPDRKPRFEARELAVSEGPFAR
ncbi:AbrB family transcriptional regulator [Streptomyces sp. TP-A0356]|uniref:AbrB family transcriptional regulator n=1 Tax=Streptomyces sp. TP-A0356 TaxID=1359208 RepID=UPI0007C7A71E|nr:AbrB family transcriptional regulator [Streptomyces sp. TP-A0356]